MKGIMIPPSLFFMLYSYFIHGDESWRDRIMEKLERKMNKIIDHDLYSKSKTAATAEEREAARKEYLNRIGVPDDFRY